MLRYNQASNAIEGNQPHFNVKPGYYWKMGLRAKGNRLKITWM